MISFVNHLSRASSFPNTIGIFTIPHIINLLLWRNPHAFHLASFRLCGKIRKSSITILLFLLLHLIQRFKICRKLENYILFNLFTRSTTWVFRYFDTKHIVGYFQCKWIKLCHLLTILLTDLWITRTVSCWSYSFVILRNR